MQDGTGGLASSLRRLESALARVGVDLARHAAPGVDEQRLVDADEQLGFRLPDDVRTLYRWHDGGADRSMEGAKSPELAVAPCWYLIGLDRAIHEHLLEREFAEAQDGPWSSDRQRLFPLFQSVTRETLVAVIEPGSGRPPAAHILWEATEVPVVRPGFGSVTDLVDLFAEVAESGDVARRRHGELEFPDGQVTARFADAPVCDDCPLF